MKQVEALALQYSGLGSDTTITSAFHPSIHLVNKFVQSFNPVLAGLRLLMLERLDPIGMPRVAPPSSHLQCLRCNLNLRRCFDSILQSTVANGCFPAIVGSIYNSIGMVAPPLVVDTCASCCISPHRGDFITYSASQVKIKDLSGINTVAGEGMIEWKVLDSFGREVVIRLKGYHVPIASIRLLSHQSLFRTFGGKGIQDVDSYTFCLKNGTNLVASYGRANLPMLELSDGAQRGCFYKMSLAFSATDRGIWTQKVLDERNQNISVAQKELLLWHH
jgi:hypothetical protein